jgi:hypothetical protein
MSDAMVKSAAIRLLLTPDRLPTDVSNRTASFIARLESTGDFVVNSHRPLVDGARVLLARGFDPATPLTMRHEGSAHDSFQPLPIGKWAGWTFSEGERRTLGAIPWKPFPAAACGRKVSSEPPVVPEGQETENRFLAATRSGRAAALRIMPKFPPADGARHGGDR